MTRKLLIGVLTILSVMSSHALEIKGFTPDKKITYKKASGVELKLDVFNPEGHKASDKRPAILFFFGGGWVGGSTSQMHPFCDYLAKRGMVAIAVEYRVYSRNKTTPAECVKDGKSAMRWVRKHAAELGVDPEKILAGGGSAGGHVAAATATVKGFDEKDDDTSISEKPVALVLFNPVYDNGPNGFGHKRVKEYWKKISPMHNLSKTTPPTIVFFGSKDKHVSVETAEKYKKQMEKHGRRCDLHIYENQKHGFFNYGKSKKYYDEIVKEMDAFLVSLGYLEKLQ